MQFYHSYLSSIIWHTELCDIIPVVHVLANVFQTTVKVFSSSLHQPYIEFQVTLQCESPVQDSKLYLAHCSIPGKEHYDYYECIKKNTENETESTEMDCENELLCEVTPKNRMRGGM